MRQTWRGVWSAALLCTLLDSTGCSLPALLKQNTETVRENTKGIAENTRIVQQSTGVTRELLPAMQGLRALSQPMNDVAGVTAIAGVGRRVGNADVADRRACWSSA